MAERESWKRGLLFPAGVGATVLLMLLAAGCNRDNQVKVYRVEKDNSTQAGTGNAAAPGASERAGQGAGQAAKPQGLSWTLPEGWKQKPAGGMRAASFTVTGKEGHTADVSVIPMPSGEPQLDLVNMWRQQMRLPAVGSVAAAEPPEPVSIGSDKGEMYDIASVQPIPDGDTRKRILVAMVTRGTTSWFFKMTGEDALVRAQEPGFVKFLKSVSLPSGPVAVAGMGDGSLPLSNPHQFLSTNARNAPGANSEKPVWVVPAGWREVPATEFLLAKFAVGGADGKAEVSVSTFGGTGGGVLANVNRWRRQLGLGPVDADALGKVVTAVGTGGGRAELVDLQGTDAKTGLPARMVAAIVSQPGQTWFYKLMGNEATVKQQKDAFTKFVETVKYPDAP